jgi:hypothetical protein
MNGSIHRQTPRTSAGTTAKDASKQKFAGAAANSGKSQIASAGQQSGKLVAYGCRVILRYRERSPPLRSIEIRIAAMRTTSLCGE